MLPFFNDHQSCILCSPDATHNRSVCFITSAFCWTFESFFISEINWEFLSIWKNRRLTSRAPETFYLGWAHRRISVPFHSTENGDISAEIMDQSEEISEKFSIELPSPLLWTNSAFVLASLRKVFFCIDLKAFKNSTKCLNRSNRASAIQARVGTAIRIPSDWNHETIANQLIKAKPERCLLFNWIAHLLRLLPLATVSRKSFPW